MTMATSPSPVTFINLAPELRNHIYQLLFTHAGILVPASSTSPSHFPLLGVPEFTASSPTKPKTASPFLQTSKQIHHEGRHYLYTQNIFQLHMFAPGMPSRENDLHALRHARKLHLRFECWVANEITVRFFREVMENENLRELTVELLDGAWEAVGRAAGSKWTIEERVSGLRKLLEPLGSVKGLENARVLWGPDPDKMPQGLQDVVKEMEEVMML